MTGTSCQFGRIPYAVMDSGTLAGLNCSAWRVYLVLCAHADLNWQARPTQERIGQLAGIDPRNVRRGVAELVAAGVVEVEPGTGRWASRYTLRADTSVHPGWTFGDRSEGTSVHRTEEKRRKNRKKAAGTVANGVKRKPKRIDYPVEFERLWTAYGKKGPKLEAYDQWNVMLKDVACPDAQPLSEWLIKRATLYREIVPKSEFKYTKDLVRWLKKGLYDFDPTALAKSHGVEVDEPQMTHDQAQAIFEAEGAAP